MKNHNAQEFSQAVYWVGARDWNRRMFDALIPLPDGTSYNSYLVKGQNKTAVIDTVNVGFEEEWTARIRQAANPEDVDYLVMNHAEPDHAGAIPYFMRLNGKATLLASGKGAHMAQVYFNVPEERIRVVGENDTIDLGGKTLRFVDAPWLHWPETMFTYVPENKALFPCDFFGSHTASVLCGGEDAEVIPAAKRYFGEIMMPFRKQGEKALKKVEELDVAVIAPSHGPIHTSPKPILDAYRAWTAGQTRAKAILVYVSMWGATESMMKTMAEALLARGIEVGIHNLVNADIGRLAGDLVDSRAIVFGSPTVLGGLHPLGVYAAHLVKVLRPPARLAAVVSSYGWGKGAIRQAQEMLGPMGLEIVGVSEVNGPPTAEDHRKVAEIGEQLAARILA